MFVKEIEDVVARTVGSEKTRERAKANIINWAQAYNRFDLNGRQME